MKAAFIGCGHVAHQHIKALRKIPGVELAGVCDKENSVAQDFANNFGIKNYFTNPDQLLQECKPEVVHILTPPQSHKDLGIKSVRAGCHIFVEKPMAMNKSDASEMIEAASLANVQLGVCHNFLFIPAVTEAREMIAEGKFGEIVFAEVFWRISKSSSGDRYQKAKWIYDLPGNIAHEIAAHPVYLLRAFWGELSVCGATSKKRHINLSGNTTDMQVFLESRTALANITISLNSEPTEKYIRILGTKNSFLIDLGSSTLIKFKPINTGNIGKAISNLDRSYQYIFQTLKNAVLSSTGNLPLGHETLIKLFYSSLKGEISNPVSGKDGLEVVSVLDNMWKYQK